MNEMSKIFKNIVIYIDGYTEPGNSELKRLICLNGGSYVHYFERNKTTHVIATRIAKSRAIEELSYSKPIPYINPKWIIDSINSNKLLSIDNYILPEMKEKNQSIIDKNTLKSNNTKVNSKFNAKDDPKFIDKYFRCSRLHFLGTFKSHLKKQKIKTIFNDNDIDLHSPLYAHIDMDCYFVNVALIKHPEYKNCPVVVSTSPDLYIINIY